MHAAELRIQRGLTGVPAIEVRGDKDDEWRFETSADLLHWTDAPTIGSTFSDAAPRDLPAALLTGERGFLKSVQTTGLFDDRLMRTLALTFTQSNWATLLTRGRDTGSNTLCLLELDNGLVQAGVGARYKGNTSFTMGGAKKSLNLEVDFIEPNARLMGYKTVNLNNAAGDETIMREAVYFNVMHEYAPSPRGSLARLTINGAYWGVYSFVEQENSILVREWFPSTDGDRWRAPNAAVGGFGSGQSALSWLGTNINTYRQHYQLKTDNSTNAWERLVEVIRVLNNTPTNQVWETVDGVLAIDRWLWFLAVENVFADDDSYFNKGADYGFYYEPESGRIHPIEHDGNESFTAGDLRLSPVEGANNLNRPVLYRVLRNPTLRQRYLAHMRTVLEEQYNPASLTSVIERMSRLSIDAIATDPKKNFTMTGYTNDLRNLKTFVTNRYNFLIAHAELTPKAPSILHVSVPAPAPTALETPTLTAQVQADPADGIDSVWLYWRTRSYGRFESVEMRDDGAHQDGAAGDGTFGAATPKYPAGTRVRYYVEARAGNAARASRFAPARAEQSTYSYRVRTSDVSDSPVVINELMADNTRTLADPQNEYDDWIELSNASEEDADLSGFYLSDDPSDPRKWRFPDGTIIPARGFLIVWADEDSSETPGVHASFRLAAGGEQVLLVDRDENGNGLVDAVNFGGQTADRSYGRDPADPRFFIQMAPSPGAANR